MATEYVIIVHMNDGSNGYNADNWQYLIKDCNGDVVWFGGGFATQERAAAAAKERLRKAMIHDEIQRLLLED